MKILWQNKKERVILVDGEILSQLYHNPKDEWIPLGDCDNVIIKYIKSLQHQVKELKKEIKERDENLKDVFRVASYYGME